MSLKSMFHKKSKSKPSNPGVVAPKVVIAPALVEAAAPVGEGAPKKDEAGSKADEAKSGSEGKGGKAPAKKIFGLPAMAVYVGGALLLVGAALMIMSHGKSAPAAAAPVAK